MKKFTQLNFIMILSIAIVFIAGCQKDELKPTKSTQQNLSNSTQIEDVSQVSLQRLAEMQYDTSVPEVLYEDIQNRVRGLSQEEYDIYLKYWIEDGAQRAIDLKVIKSSEKESEIQKEYEKRNNYNVKALEIYNIPMYKLSPEKQLNVVEKLKQDKRISQL